MSANVPEMAIGASHQNAPMEWVHGFLAARFEFDGLVAMLQGFFDESATHRGSAVTCIAGVLFDDTGLTDFTKEWHPHVNGLSKSFRTSDAVHGHGAFCSWPSGQRAVLLDRLAGLTTNTRRLGIIASMTQADYNTYKAGCASSAIIPSLYVLCLATCLEMIGNLLTTSSETVNYVFEQGDAYEAEASEFLRLVSSKTNLKDRFRIEGYGFQDKRTVIALHAADFVAWEWQKNYKDIVSGREERWTDRMKILQRDKVRLFVRHLGPVGIGLQDMLNTIYLSN